MRRISRSKFQFAACCFMGFLLLALGLLLAPSTLWAVTQSRVEGGRPDFAGAAQYTRYYYGIRPEFFLKVAPRDPQTSRPDQAINPDDRTRYTNLHSSSP